MDEDTSGQDVNDNVEQLDQDDLESIEIINEDEDQEPDQTFTTFETDDQGNNVSAIEEEQQENEQVEEPEEEVEHKKKAEKKKKHSSLKAEFNRVQRDKYQALNEVEQLKKENERLQKLASQNAEAAMGHHDKAIELKIKQAKAAKAAAYDAADTEALVQADELLTEAMYQKAESDRWKAEQKYLQQNQQRQQPQQQPQQVDQGHGGSVEISDEAENWLSNNQWFDRNSNEYDPGLYNVAQKYSLLLEEEYLMRGEESKIFTQEYFDDIDQYMNQRYFGVEDDAEPQQIRKAPVKSQQQPARMNLNMKQVRQNVAPVGKTIKQAASPNPNRVVLTAREREFAKTMNLKPEEYAREKLKIQKSGRYDYEQNRR